MIKITKIKLKKWNHSKMKCIECKKIKKTYHLYSEYSKMFLEFEIFICKNCLVNSILKLRKIKKNKENYIPPNYWYTCKYCNKMFNDLKIRLKQTELLVIKLLRESNVLRTNKKGDKIE